MRALQSRRLRGRELPLSSLGDYEVESFRLVFLPAATTGAEVGRERRSPGGSRPTTLLGRVGEISSGGLRWLRTQLRGFSIAAKHYQALQLTCENCGHIILLNGTKVGATVEFIDPWTGSS
jgi:hypothetical protein